MVFTSDFDINFREFLLTSFDNGYDYFSIFSYFTKQFQFLQMEKYLSKCVFENINYLMICIIPQF